MRVLSTIGALLFFALGIFQLFVGYVGIEEHFGVIWASIGLFIAIFFRISLPMTIGCFFGLTDVFGWHWLPALVLTIPGLLFMVPAIAFAIIGPMLVLRKRNTSSADDAYDQGPIIEGEAVVIDEEETDKKSR